MPTNTGTPPSHDRVDIELQCGWVIRNVDPKKYDWNLGDQCAGIPIVRWQTSK